VYPLDPINNLTLSFGFQISYMNTRFPCNPILWLTIHAKLSGAVHNPTDVNPTVPQSGRINRQHEILLGPSKRKHGPPRSDHLGPSIILPSYASVDELSTWTQDQAFGLQGLHRVLIYIGNTYFYAFHRILISTDLVDMYFPIHPFSTGWGREHRSGEEVTSRDYSYGVAPLCHTNNPISSSYPHTRVE
jgi:hypothetical protein